MAARWTRRASSRRATRRCCRCRRRSRGRSSSSAPGNVHRSARVVNASLPPVALVTGGAGGMGGAIAAVCWPTASGSHCWTAPGRRQPPLSAELRRRRGPGPRRRRHPRGVRPRRHRRSHRHQGTRRAGQQRRHRTAAHDGGSRAGDLAGHADVNLTGPALMIKHCIPWWRRPAGAGLFDRIAGLAGWWLSGVVLRRQGGTYRSDPRACRELGPLGVTVNVVAPSFLRTPFNAGKGDPGSSRPSFAGSPRYHRWGGWSSRATSPTPWRICCPTGRAPSPAKHCTSPPAPTSRRSPMSSFHQCH